MNTSSLGGTQKFCYSRFFIIKSYSEEDVHKAIKYNVWSSTDKGNKILDSAYVDVQNFKMSQQENLEPEPSVYLFFSVNQSKHFCGVAKMMSRVNSKVDHSDLWKQSGKWTGSIQI